MTCTKSVLFKSHSCHFFKPLLVSLFLLASIVSAERYERKSISFYATPLQIGGEALPEPSVFADEVRSQLGMIRFDQNEIPLPIQETMYADLSTGTVDAERISAAVGQYFVTPILDALQKFGEVRAVDLLSEQEKNSFVTAKCKMSGITMDHVRKVYNSAYFFQLVIREVGYEKKKDFLTKKEYMEGSIKGSMYWISMEYTNGNLAMRPFAELPINEAFGQAELGYDEKRAGLSLKQVIFRKLYSGTMLGLQTASRKLEPFKLREQILEASFNSVTMPLGSESGLYPNQGFKIIALDDSKDSAHRESEAGYVKVRDVGEGKSRAQIRYGGDIYIGMIVREYPQSGFVNSVGGGIIPLAISGDTLTNGFILKSRYTMLPSLSLEFGRESRSVNEMVFFNQWAGGFSMLDARVRNTIDTGWTKDIYHWALFTTGGIEKKFCLRRFSWIVRAGVFVGGTLKFWSEDNTNFKIEHSLYGISYGVQGKTGFEWMVSADKMFGIRAGYQFGLPAGWVYKVKVENKKSSAASDPAKESDFSGKAEETATGVLFEAYYRVAF